MTYYRCMMSGGSGDFPVTLTVTCDSAFVGETLYLTKGLIVLSKTVPATGIVEFEFPENGTWVLSNSLTSDTETFENVGEYETNLYSVPDGKTVLPTDDIQIWLSCAGIRDKAYTTLAEVLADTTTLLALINSHNAVDYMVRSTTLAVSVSVPIMTSDTTPEGECVANAVYGAHTPAWKAFDGDDSTYWIPTVSTSPNYIEYDFASPVKVKKVTMKVSQVTGSGGYPDVPSYVQAWDGEEWVSISNTISVTTSSSNIEYTINNNNVYSKYRIYFDGAVVYGNNRNFQVNTIRFDGDDVITDNETAMSYIGANDYAADTLLADPVWNEAIQNSEYFESVDNAKVPVMTSNTTPSGECIGKSYYGSGYEYYKAFDGNTSGAIGSLWEGAISGGNYIGYLFGRDVSIKLIKYISRDASDGNSNRNVKDFTLQSTADGTTWNDVGSAKQGAKQADNSFVINDTNSGIGYRMNITTNYGSTWIDILELQFYGRQPGGVQTLLNAAGITDKDYTTLAELLNDPVSLNTVMQSKDAVDYLVTCKGWIDDVVANQDAMSYIGLSNYASDTLLADEDWFTAIYNSTYFESVLNVKVPTMTNNTTPSGTCFASSNSSNAYKAFDKVLINSGTNAWEPPDNSTNNRVGYDFGSNKRIFVAEVTMYDPNSGESFYVHVQSSLDGSNYNELDAFTYTSTGQKTSKVYFDSTARYFSVFCASNMHTPGRTPTYFVEIQFYGREDV